MTAKKMQKDTTPHSAADTVSSIDPETPSDVQETTVSSQLGVSSGKTNLSAALAKAQAECQNVVMNKTNPHFKSRYADLAAVRDAIIPIFAKHGLSIVQAPTTNDFSGFSLETRLIHSSGEYMVWNFPLPTDVNKMQSIGSAISYARRYTYSSLAAIASEEDDDGNAATTTNGGGRSNNNASSAGPGPSSGPSSPQGGIVL